METTVSYLLMLQKYISSKQKNLKKKDYAPCLGNISKNFTTKNMKKKTGLKRTVKIFPDDFDPIDTNDILNIPKYVIPKYVMKGT